MKYTKRQGLFGLTGVLFSSVHYPTDYGFIPGTKSADGDPLDVLIIIEERPSLAAILRSGQSVSCGCGDEKGIDEKILAVPVSG